VNQPEQKQIDHWLSVSKEAITEKWELRNSRFYEKENLPLQGMYCSLAGFHSSLARAKFLNGDPIESVRAEFANAARHVMKSFTMAYDEDDPDFQGENADLSCVSEGIAIEGMNWALMSADFKLAAEVANHYRTRPDGYMLSRRSNRYANALALTIQGRQKEALPLLTAQFEDYKKRPPKSAGDKNYYTLILALFGIVTRDGERFSEGLELQLKLYQGYAKGEGSDTDEEFICDHAVALAILGQHNRMRVGVRHATLPRGLLLT